MLKKDRIKYIDIARGIAIFLVVLGHCITNFKTNYVYRIIYTYHMPLFFIISGMLLNVPGNGNYPVSFFLRKIWKRCCQYYIPVLFWGCIYSFVNQRKLNFNIIKQVAYGTRESLKSVESLTSIWFLSSLLVAVIICELLIRAYHEDKNYNFVLFGAMVLFVIIGYKLPHLTPYGWPLGADIGYLAAGFMIFGHFVRILIDKIKKNRKFVIICFLIFAGLKIWILCDFIPQNIVLMWKTEYGNNFALFLWDAVIQSLFVLFLSLVFDLFFSKIAKPLIFIGQNTMGILLFHKPIINVVKNIISEIGYKDNSFLFFCCIMLITMIISTGIAVVYSNIKTCLLNAANRFVKGFLTVE